MFLTEHRFMIEMDYLQAGLEHFLNWGKAKKS